MGFIVGILNAFTVSFQHSIFKELNTTSPASINWWRFGIAVPFMAILVSLFSTWSFPTPSTVLIIVLLSLPLEIFQSHFLVKAYQHSPQSLVGPLFSFSAILLVPLGYLINGELPSTLGLLGILSVVVGPFFLSENDGQGLLASYRKVFSEKGSHYMLLSALFASIAVTTAKFAYNSISPLLFSFYITLILFLTLSLRLAYGKTNPFSVVSRKQSLLLVGVGSLYSISSTLHYIGISLLISAYYISIKRFSTVFDVILGATFYKEENFRNRFIGSIVMILGVILIALG